MKEAKALDPSVAAKQASQQISKPKKRTSFQKMKDKAKKRGFTNRVNPQDKATVSAYLNEEIKRHIDLFMEKKAKVQAEYEAEKTRIRRSFRQKQSERAKNHLSEETKDGLDEKKEQELAALKEKFKAKGADPLQADIIEGIKRAASQNEVEMEVDSIGFVAEKNVSTHHEGKSLSEVLQLMIDKLRNNIKTVDTM